MQQMVLLKADDAIILLVFFLYGMFVLSIFALYVTCRWKIFVKAGQEGWHALIPYYSTYILTCKVAGKDEITFILSILPFVRIYGTIVTHLALAKSFGKDDGFGIGLVFLWFIFYPILAFSKKVTYIGPNGVPIHKDSSNSLTTDWQKS